MIPDVRFVGLKSNIGSRDIEGALLPGLVPQRPGPKRAHKLSEPVLDVLEAARAAQPSLNSTALARIVAERFGLRVHPRSVERALQRRGKGGPAQIS